MWDRNKRLLGEAALDKLQSSTVAIVGLGSLGSQTAVLLAMSGVGGFVLIDPDVLEEHNVVRHAADLRYVGLPKVEAVANLVRLRNPKARVRAIRADARKRSKTLAKIDLVIVAGLGSEIAQQQMGQLLLEIRRPTLFGGVYPRGVAGEVLFVDTTENGPCYACFATLLRETQPIGPEIKVDYGLPPDEIQAVPFLGVHVCRVATVLADWAIRLIVNDPTVLKPFPGNLVILNNEERQVGRNSRGAPVIMPPLSSLWKTVARNPECLICGTTEVSKGTVDELLEKEE